MLDLTFLEKESLAPTLATRDVKVNIGNNKGDDLKVLDFGLNLLFVYQLNAGLNFGVGYDFELTNLKPTSTNSTNVQ